MLYGYTLHLELIDLRDAGLSNYAALEAATRNPALFFGTIDKTGTIEKGKRADLVLLDANPLEDIANTQKRSGVMLKGRYYLQFSTRVGRKEVASKVRNHSWTRSVLARTILLRILSHLRATRRYRVTVLTASKYVP